MSAPASYGQAALALVDAVLDLGVTRAALLMRHSAREFNRDIHDLLNPLTDPGRGFCRELGRALPKSLYLRGYHSPPERCAETAALIVDTHTAHGGRAGKTRAVESLGPFWALDQIKMWKAMEALGGNQPFIEAWCQGRLPADVMIDGALSARLIVRSTLERLRAAREPQHLDLCVTHDTTLWLLKDRLLEQPATEVDSEFLDAIVLYEQDDGVWLQSRHGPARNVAAALAEL